MQLQLTELTLRNFRRFSDESVMDLFSPVVAVIGPNEAGKSTILDALLFLNVSAARHSRYSRIGSREDVVLSAEYLLEQDDVNALKRLGVQNPSNLFTLVRTLDSGDSISDAIYPQSRMPRSLRERKVIAEKLFKLVTKEEITERFRDVNGVTVESVFQNALKVLNSDVDELSDSDFSRLRALPRTLRKFNDYLLARDKPDSHPWPSGGLIRIVESLETYTETDSPTSIYREYVSNARPVVRLFSEQDRILKSRYNMKELAQKPPSSLKNLLNAVDTNAEDLVRKCLNTESYIAQGYLKLVNNRLKSMFLGKWDQSDVTVELSVNRDWLEIIVVTEGSEDSRVSSLDHRSEGFRTYVALWCFVASLDQDKPLILLVDEAESHLHYDAQARLVDLFHDQEVASKIVYTTHSAACLPRNISQGVTVVSPLDASTSNVRKGIWTSSNDAGYSTMLFALGATTFGFLPMRRTLFVEGETDAILYPALFQEAGGKKTQPKFQILPGISSMSENQLAAVKSHGKSVFFLIDGDEGGKDLRKKLDAAGVEAAHILDLGALKDGSTLEDILDEEFFFRILESAQIIVGFDLDSLCASATPFAGRYEWLKGLLGRSVPSKALIARIALDLIRRDKLERRKYEYITPDTREWLRKQAMTINSSDVDAIYQSHLSSDDQ